MGDPKGAIEDFNRVIDIDPASAAAFNNRATARTLTRDYDGAVADCTRALELAPDYVNAYLNRAVAKRGKRDFQGALDDASKALDRDPMNAAAFASRGKSRAYLTDWKGSLDDLGRSLALRTTGSTYFDRGCVFYFSQSWGNAAADFRKALETLPKERDQPFLRLWLARVRLGEREAATKEWRAYLQARDPARRDDWYGKISAFLLEETTEQDLLAAAGTGDAGEDRARSCEAHLYLGTRRLISGDRSGAMEHLKKCTDGGESNFYTVLNAVAELAAIEKGN